MSERALEAALSVEETRTEVFAMVNHDLWNPLCVILGYADMTAEQADKVQEPRAVAQVVSLGWVTAVSAFAAPWLVEGAVDAALHGFAERAHERVETFHRVGPLCSQPRSSQPKDSHPARLP